MRKLFFLGLFLFLISAPPLFLMVIEYGVGFYAYSRYKVTLYTGKNYDYRSAEFHDHKVELSDFRSARLEPAHPLHQNPIRITIDGQDWSIPSTVRKNPFDDYQIVHRPIAIINLKDQQLNTERLAIIQAIGGKNYPNDIRYRLLFLTPTGTITEEWFQYSERREPLYRTLLARFVHPEPICFYSNLLSVWPSIFYPLTYPVVTGFLGILLSVIAGIMRLKKQDWSSQTRRSGIQNPEP